MDTLGRDNLEQWLAEMRPRVHCFCGRIMGSGIDGEDVAQEALARAAIAFPQAGPIGEDISHPDPAASSDARAEVTLGFTAFLPLPPPQRASVVLVDILGYSLAETAAILETSVAAVKATLHRGRTRLAAEEAPPPAKVDPRDRMQLSAYADLFNARAFDALRDLLAADVRLDLIRRVKLEGKTEVGIYFTRYQETPIRWHLQPVLADGRLALLATDSAGSDERSLVLLDWSSGRIAAIRDFFYARYVMEGMAIAQI